MSSTYWKQEIILGNCNTDHRIALNNHDVHLRMAFLRIWQIFLYFVASMWLLFPFFWWGKLSPRMFSVSQHHSASTHKVTFPSVLGSLFWQGSLVPMVGIPAEIPQSERKWGRYKQVVVRESMEKYFKVVLDNAQGQFDYHGWKAEKLLGWPSLWMASRGRNLSEKCDSWKGNIDGQGT